MEKTMQTNTTISMEQEAKELLPSLWWMPLIRGLLLIIIGILMFSKPGATLLNLLWFMGIYWIVDGIFSIIESIRGHTETSRLWTFLGAIVSILAGFFILGNPIIAGLISGTFLAYLIGIATIISGIMTLIAGRNGQWTWGGLIMGILYIIFGLIVVTHPLATLASLVWLFSIWAIAAGIIAMILAFRLRSLAA